MTTIIYHANCDDCFGAAFAAWLKLGDSARYVPANYGEPPVEVESGDKVVLCDFSYSRDVVLNIAKKVNLTILDHHKTAMDELGDLSFAHFDMEKSGAVLAWEYFLPDALISSFFMYIQDRDLWRNELNDGRAFTAGLRSYPQDFTTWLDLSRSGPRRLIEEGKPILRYIDQQASILAEQWKTTEVGPYYIPAVNAPKIWASEICEKLLDKGSDIVAVWSEYPDRTEWSLRSRGDFDVGELAKGLGGGGHKNAAGFRTSVIV